MLSMPRPAAISCTPCCLIGAALGVAGEESQSTDTVERQWQCAALTFAPGQRKQDKRSSGANAIDSSQTEEYATRAGVGLCIRAPFRRALQQKTVSQPAQ